MKDLSRDFCIFLMLTAVTGMGMQAAAPDKNIFKVFDGQQLHDVKHYDVDPILRKMKTDQLRAFLEQGCKIRAIKLSNGEYLLRAHVPGLGGGPIGATVGCVAGKVASEAVCHGGLWVISWIGGPFQPVVQATLEATLAIPIEGITNTIAVGCGIAGAVITGPV